MEEKLANLNQIYLLGNLTRDPELRYTNEGMAITEMGMAVNKRWKDANGDENSVVDFFNVTVWNHLAENCAGSLKKGDRIMVGGHLNLRSWENKDGKKYNIVNITADVAALSLEFNKANNHEGRTNGANNHEARPERINSCEIRSEEADSAQGSDKTSSNESSDKTNINESRPDKADGAIGRPDKMDNGGGRPDGKNKKKDQEKKQDGVSIAQDLAADYSLEVVSR
jgi:single-strand DNA-binding protein